MKIIDGKNIALGRLASYTAKELLKGEEVAIVNCEAVIITGNKKDIKEKFEAKRGRVGSGQQGPKHSRLTEKIVKRTIRGMLPDHRRGRGREAFKRVKCYIGTPKEFEGKDFMKLDTGNKQKAILVKDIYK
jgi:large subunit ribosomal protein L13